MTLSFAGPVYLLSVFAIFGFFFFPSPLEPRLSRNIALVGVVAFGAILFLAQPTFPDHAAGRWGGYLWNLAGFFPDPAGRNLLFAVLCPSGMVYVVRLWQALSIRGNSHSATVFILGLTAWAATFIVNRQVFHRYFEPTILVFLIALVPLLLPGAHNLRRWRLGLGLCSALQLALTLATAHLAVWR